jgi:hypothetical protein
MFPPDPVLLLRSFLKNREYPPFLAVPHRPDRFGAMIPQGAKNVAATEEKDILCPGCKIHDLVALSPRTIHQSRQP